MSKNIKLSQWAKENNVEYKEAWNQYNTGILPVKARKSNTGRIWVELEESKASEIPKQKPVFGVPSITDKNPKNSSIASTRSNRAALSLNSNQFFHIENGIDPICIDSKGNISVAPAINLSRKAYFNFPIVANIIDTMTQFSTNKIYFREGNAKSRKFFENWLNSIGYLDLQDKFFRELYRGSNVPIYKFEGIPSDDNLKNINKTFGAQAEKDTKIPIKYIILNPADIIVKGSLNFGPNTIYYKILNGYEINRLKNPQTKEEQSFLDSLTEEARKQIKAGSNSINIPLNTENLYMVFYRKQDYEALAIPLIYPVLKDIEWKAEMKHIDMAVSRVMNNTVLLVTNGYIDKEGNLQIDQATLQALNELMSTETVGRTLVADTTTKVEHVIPNIGAFLDPKKYEIVNEDIRTGLNYILTGGGTESKFANQYIQVQLFIQRLEQAREAFLNNFLIPEIKKIGEALGFRKIPIPFFETIGLEDPAEFNRIVSRLWETGLLTPPETLQALESQRLPTGEESEEAWNKFKELKDKGMYQPIIGGPQDQLNLTKETNKNALKIQDNQLEHDKTQKSADRRHQKENPQTPAPQIVVQAPTKMGQPAGRPSGSKRPQSTKKIKPSKASEELYSLSKIKDNLILAGKLKEEIVNIYLNKYNLKKLNEEQIAIAEDIRQVVLSNEEPENWISKAKEYVENPVDSNLEKIEEINEISYFHQISPFLATILASSKTEEKDN